MGMLVIKGRLRKTWKEAGIPVTQGMEKTELLHKVFGSTFTSNCSRCTAGVPGGKGRDWENEGLTAHHSRSCLTPSKVHKSMGPDEMCNCRP